MNGICEEGNSQVLIKILLWDLPAMTEENNE
jgi:hypothetical protein